MLTKVKIIAELNQRYVAGGNRSNDLEFFWDEMYPLIESYAVSTFSVAMAKSMNPQEVINNQFLKRISCVDFVGECICNNMEYYYDIPPIILSNNRGQMPKIMALPNDLGIFDIQVAGYCNSPIRQTTQEFDRTHGATANLMGSRWKVIGNRIIASELWLGATILYVPTLQDLADNDILPLLPAAEIGLWDYLKERYTGWGLLPKDYMTDSQDVKTQTINPTR